MRERRMKQGSIETVRVIDVRMLVYLVIDVNMSRCIAFDAEMKEVEREKVEARMYRDIYDY